MGKRKDRSEKKEKSKKKKYDYSYEEDDSNSVLPLDTMFTTLITNYPKDVNNFRDLLQNLDEGYHVDISELEDRSVKNVLTDMFKEHFNLKRDKETREYKKRSSQKNESLVKLFEDFIEHHQYKPTTPSSSSNHQQPKSLLEMHKANNSQSELNRQNLERKGFLTFDRDRDIENPYLAVDKKRLLETINNASKFSQKFNSTTEYKFM